MTDQHDADARKLQANLVTCLKENHAQCDAARDTIKDALRAIDKAAYARGYEAGQLDMRERLGAAEQSMDRIDLDHTSEYWLRYPLPIRALPIKEVDHG